MDDSVLRKQLVDLLRGGHAHVAVKRALTGIAPEIRVHSIWEELEHMRIAQEDILRYTLDSSWQSPAWPAGYWPSPAEKISDAMWEGSIASFLSDLDEVIRMVEDHSRELTAEIPHGEGRTYLRQILLVADHNAYHLGQIVQARKILNNWSQ
jgi:hypothetical protein